MSIDIDEFELKIDGKESNSVLLRYKDGDDSTYLDNLESGYYPLDKNRDYITDEKIIEKVAKSFPDSEIFFRIVTDYGECAYLHKNGITKKLKKEWK